MNIEYRNITKKDYKEIKRLIKSAWFKDDYIPGEKHNYNVYSKGYLYMHLSGSSYRIAAYDKDKLVGFLFGRAENEKRKSYLINRILLFFTGIQMLFTKIGRRGLKVHKIENRIDKKLRKEYDKEDNELCLFIVDESYRKLGIGSRLEELFCDHLRKLNKHELYLYTDTYSNYHYYEKRGYTRYKTINSEFDIDSDNEGEKAKYFIYIKDLQN